MKYFSPFLLDGSVTEAKLADNSVTTAKLVDLAVTEAKIGALAVANAKIASLAVNAPKIAVASITPAKLRTVSVSLSGSISGNSTVDLLLTFDCLWPMIHVSDQDKVGITGHITDAPGPDNPRVALNNNSAGAETYDVDYRHINS